jgi:hypothetical protein
MHRSDSSDEVEASVVVLLVELCLVMAWSFGARISPACGLEKLEHPLGSWYGLSDGGLPGVEEPWNTEAVPFSCLIASSAAATAAAASGVMSPSRGTAELEKPSGV